MAGLDGRARKGITAKTMWGAADDTATGHRYRAAHGGRRGWWWVFGDAGKVEDGGVRC